MSGGEGATFLLPVFSPISIHSACTPEKAATLNGKYISGDRHPALSRTFTAGRQSWRGRGRGRKGEEEGGEV